MATAAAGDNERVRKAKLIAAEAMEDALAKGATPAQAIQCFNSLVSFLVRPGNLEAHEAIARIDDEVRALQTAPPPPPALSAAKKSKK